MACCFTKQLLHSLYLVQMEKMCKKYRTVGSDAFTGDWDKLFRDSLCKQETRIQHFSSLPVQNLKVSSPTIDLLTLDTESVVEQQVVCVNA